MFCDVLTLHLSRLKGIDFGFSYTVLGCLEYVSAITDVRFLRTFRVLVTVVFSRLKRNDNYICTKHQRTYPTYISRTSNSRF